MNKTANELKRIVNEERFSSVEVRVENNDCEIFSGRFDASGVDCPDDGVMEFTLDSVTLTLYYEESTVECEAYLTGYVYTLDSTIGSVCLYF